MFGEDATEPLVGLPAAVAGVGLLVVTVAQILVSIAAVRTFASDETETIPEEYFTRKVLWAVGNLVVGWILFGIAVSIGFVLLFVPGLFLLTSLFFWGIIVVVEDETFIEGFSRSWHLTSGNRWALFVLGVIVVLLGLIVNTIGTRIGNAGPPLFAVVVSALVSAPVFVFTTATAARTYRHLERGATPENAVEDEFDVSP